MTPKEYEKIHQKCLVIDLDGTLSIDENKPYKDRAINAALVATLKGYKDRGFRIIIHTSRSMRSYAGDVAKIKTNALPEILEWLERHGVPYDEVVVGKPWCGTNGFYVDDRALRPSEFVSLSYDEIILLLAREKEVVVANFNKKLSQNKLNSQKNSSTNSYKNSSKKSLNSKSKNSQKNSAKKSLNLKPSNLKSKNSNKNSLNSKPKNALNSKSLKYSKPNKSSNSKSENSNKNSLNSKPSKSKGVTK